MMRRFTSIATPVSKTLVRKSTSSANIFALPNHARLVRSYATEEKVPSELVKQIRAETSAPLGQILKALKASNNNVEEAKKRLRELGMSIAAHKATRAANQGVVGYLQITPGDFVLFEINCETDFVARGEEFGKLIERAQEELTKNPDQSSEQLAEVLKPDSSALTLKVGENITIPRVERFKGDNVFIYLHNKVANGTNIAGSLAAVDLSVADEALGSQVAMHICGMNPLYTDKASVPQSAIDEERASITEIFRREQEKLSDEIREPEERVPKVLDRKVDKWLKEVCLVEQEWILNSKKTVTDILKSKNAEIKNWRRIKVGVRE